MTKARKQPRTKAPSKIQHEPGLLLQDANGKQVELKASHLEKWFARAESSLRQGKHKLTNQEIEDGTPRLSTQFLSHFGLQTPQDVITFLKSPAGAALLTLINKQLAEMAAMEEDIQQDMLAQQRLEKRVLAFLLLGLMHKRAHAKQANEQAQHAIDQHLQTEEKAAAEKRHTAAAAAPVEMDVLKNSIAAYDEAFQAISAVLDNKLQESHSLEKKLAEIEQQLEVTAKKYAQYNDQIDITYQEVGEYSHLTPIDVVQQRIDELAGKFESEVDEISRLIDAGQDDVAREIIEKCNARNMQIGVLQDMLAVIKGDKVLYKLNGEPAVDFNDADFILAPENKLVLKDGEYYLVGADDKLEDMTDDEREEGKEAYLRLRPEIMGVKKLVQHNEALERTEHNNVKTALSARSETMQQDILLLANQLTLVQAARANAQSLLQQIQQTTPTLKMSPLPSPSRTQNTPSASYLTNVYREMLELMRLNPSKRALDWLKATMPGNADPAMRANLNKLTPGMPIPPALMKLLLARPDIGNLLMNQSALDAFQNAEPSPSTAPTPFSMTPKLRPY